MSTLPDADELRAIALDAIPTMDEQVADWRGVPLSEVTEDMRMRWLDWLRDVQEMAG